MWTVPNILTVGRIAAAPAVALMVLAREPWAEVAAFALFAAAALTDFLDGWLARRLGQVSPLGTMLDPIADKAMVILVLAALVGRTAPETLVVGNQTWSQAPPASWLLTIPALAIMLREVLVAGLREHLGAIKLAVTWLAKGKTAVQMVAIGLLLAPPALSQLVAMPRRYQDFPEMMVAQARIGDVYWLGILLLWVAAGLTVASGIDYFRKATPHLRG
ncbi:MAG: CDP-alcohol phosphatidyltransferase family protein [Pseudomonadota bacterium]